MTGVAKANPVALRALRNLLEAAHALEVEIEGSTPIRVEARRTHQPDWPGEIECLDPERDGPWPAPVDLYCQAGGEQVVIRLSVRYWRTTDMYRHGVGLKAAVVETGTDIVWISVEKHLRNAGEAKHAFVSGASSLRSSRSRPPGLTRALNASLRATQAAMGWPSNTSAVELFQVELPSGDLAPSPAVAFENLVRFCVLKQPHHVWTTTGPQGPVLFSLDVELDDTGAGHPGDEGGRLGLMPLPGGVRNYKDTLDTVLRWLHGGDRSSTDLKEFFREHFEVTGARAVDTYISVLDNLGLVELDDTSCLLTDTGDEYLSDPSSVRLFGLLHHAYQGMLESLVVASDEPEDDASFAARLEFLLGRKWQTATQVYNRRNWLLSLELTERTAGSDAVADLGREVLELYAETVVPIRARLAGRGDDRKPINGPSGVPVVTRVDLTSARVASYLGPLRLPASVVERCCAALSTGKHLLLVGPPGTGKTQLALALSEAARAERYCEGLFPATASADWTTFETIGGYALTDTGALAFRPGVFLRALEENQWLLIDELNRMDVDRAFGELMTVLAGGTTTTPFLREGQRIHVGPDADAPFAVPTTFRVLATMNTWDKTSLFRLSYAVQRRFAIVPVDAPSDAVYRSLLHDRATRDGVDSPVAPEVAEAVVRMFSRSDGLLGLRAVGPAVPLDMVRYMRRRGAGLDGLVDAVVMYLLAQLEGLGKDAAAKAWDVLDHATLGASDDARAELRGRFAELFPHLALLS